MLFSNSESDGINHREARLTGGHQAVMPSDVGGSGILSSRRLEEALYRAGGYE